MVVQIVENISKKGQFQQKPTSQVLNLNEKWLNLTHFCILTTLATLSFSEINSLAEINSLDEHQNSNLKWTLLL